MNINSNSGYKHLISEDDFFTFYQENKINLLCSVSLFGAIAELFYAFKHFFVDTDFFISVLLIRLITSTSLAMGYLLLKGNRIHTRKKYETVSFSIGFVFVSSLLIASIPFNIRYNIDVSVLVGLPVIILFGGLTLRKTLNLLGALWVVYMVVIFKFMDLQSHEYFSSIVLTIIITTLSLLAKQIIERGEFKRMELHEVLRGQQLLYQQLTESSLDLVCQHKLNCNVSFISDSITPLLGYQKDEIINTSFYNLIHPEDIERINRTVHIPALKGASSTEECRLQHKDGSYQWYQMSTNPIIEYGEVVNLQTYSRNIDTQKCVQLENLAKQSKLDSLFANSYDITFIVDLNFQFKFISESLYPILGYKSSLAIESDIKRIFSEESKDKILAQLKFIKESKPEDILNIPIILDLEVLSKDLKSVHLEVISRPVLDESDEIVMIGTGRDVTLSKQTLDNLRLSELRLQELNHQKDHFFAIISHDLRTPFNNLMQLMGHLETNVDQLSKQEILELVKYLNNSSKSTKNLLDNLLQWARSQMSNVSITHEEFKLKDVVNHVMEILKTDVDEKEIKIAFDLEDSKIFGDRIMTATVIRNLISNAIKFTPNHGLITIQSQTIGNELLVKVLDTGVGLSEKQLDKLFVQTINNSTPGTNYESGSGMGLKICQDLLVKQGGKLTIESTEGVGTCCSFRLQLNAVSGLN